MCVYSMVADSYLDRWRQLPKPEIVPLPPALPWPYPLPIPAPMPPLLTPAEIAELKRLLANAKEIDDKVGQPACENDKKRQQLIDLAKELGATVTLP